VTTPVAQQSARHPSRMTADVREEPSAADPSRDVPTSVQAPNYGRAGVGVVGVGAAGVVDGLFCIIED
jgi:hypothetical protein